MLFVWGRPNPSGANPAEDNNNLVWCAGDPFACMLDAIT